MLRSLLVILACLTTVFGAALEETTLAPTLYVEDGNDQEPPPVFLDEESETEAFENSNIVGGDEDEKEPDEEQAKEGESNADDESDQNEGEIVEGGGDDVESELESNIGNDTKNTTLVEHIEDTSSHVGDALAPSAPSKDEEEGNDGGDTSPGELSLGGNSESGAGDDSSDQKAGAEEDEGKDEAVGDNQKEGGDDKSASSGTVNPGFDDIIEVPTSTPFTMFPTAYRPPTLPTLRPAVPYVSAGEDPLKADDNEWKWNGSTVDEMEHDKTVLIALSIVFGFMFFFSIFVAYQLLENPDGCCSSICRITVACWCGIIRCICYPCRAMCGCTGQSGGQHMIVPDDGHFTHDLELS